MANQTMTTKAESENRREYHGKNDIMHTHQNFSESRIQSQRLRRNLTCKSTACFCLALLQVVAVASAASWVQQAKITNCAGMGVDLSIDGTKAIAGGGNRAVPLEKSSTGKWQTQVYPGTYANMWFGYSLGISDSGYAVMGAPLFSDYGNFGTVYFWKQVESWRWAETDSFMICCSGLGEAVATADNLAVIGYPDYAGKGLVEIYEPTADGNWNRSSVLLPDDLSDSASFGYAVAITKRSGFYFLAVGAPGDSAIYIYRKTYLRPANQWVLDTKLTSSSGLGGYLSIAGDVLVSGEARSSDVRAIVYRRRSDGRWILEDAFALGVLGQRTSETSFLDGPVATDGNFIAFGAGTWDRVFIYTYTSSGWTYSDTLVGQAGSFFGWAIDMSLSQLIVSSPYENTTYIYEHR